MIGIYTITNKINGKIYIGQSTDIEKRWYDHTKGLNGQYHENSRLQNAWNKYGEKSFSFKVLVECEEELLYSEEHYWAVILDVLNDRYGYNIRPTNPYGLSRFSEDSKKKMSHAQKKVWKENPERSANQSKRMKGKQYGLGNVISHENRVKINEAHARRKKVRPPKKTKEEVRQMIIERNKENKYGLGRIKSPEELMKMKVAHEKRKAEGWINPLKGSTRPEYIKNILRERAKVVVCYNNDSTFYRKFRSIQTVLEQFEEKCSDVQLRRSIKSGKIYRNKYWKYENINN